jgi:hypothetical protein
MHTGPVMLMGPGAGGGFLINTSTLEAGVVPQPFEAVTVTVPPFESALAMMALVVELPVHPLGSVHV